MRKVCGDGDGEYSKQGNTGKESLYVCCCDCLLVCLLTPIWWTVDWWIGAQIMGGEIAALQKTMQVIPALN